jgi:ribosome-associated protein
MTDLGVGFPPVGRRDTRPGPVPAVHGRSASGMEGVIEPEDTATALAKAALEKKAFDIALLDMRGLVDYCDIFVICSARNRRQVQAIAEAVRVHGKRELGLKPQATEGLEAARWVLVDFGDVVVHVFEEPMRGFYNLDGLWSDAPRLEAPEGGGMSMPFDDDDDDDDLPQIG